jgi:hypothetical protein
MGLIPAGLTVLEAVAGGLLSPVLFLPRSVGGFVADVTVEEDHVDELEITHFPVEQGAAITDHSFKLPAQVRILCGFSNSSPAALGDQNYVRSVYDQFLTLQASRQPFDIFTGKRVYQNMLIRRLHTKSDKDNENILMLDVECVEIILVTTQTATVPPASSMQNPQNNAATSNSGNQSLQPGTNFDSAQALADGITPP